MDGTPIQQRWSGLSSKILSMLPMSITSRRRYLRQHKSGITAYRYFLSGFLITGLALGCRAASVVTGYVQSQPPGVQPANPNVTSITAGNVTDTALTAGGCVQASGTGQLSVTGISCGSGGGSGGVSVYPATATASFPYGFSASTAAFNSSGNGQITLTISGSTYTVISSSITPVVGQYLIFSSTNNTVGLSTGTGGSGGGSGNAILNQSTLQTGATAYPDFIYVNSSATIYGPIVENGGATENNLYFTQFTNVASMTVTNNGAAQYITTFSTNPTSPYTPYQLAISTIGPAVQMTNFSASSGTMTSSLYFPGNSSNSYESAATFNNDGMQFTGVTTPIQASTTTTYGNILWTESNSSGTFSGGQTNLAGGNSFISVVPVNPSGNYPSLTLSATGGLGGGNFLGGEVVIGSTGTNITFPSSVYISPYVLTVSTTANAKPYIIDVSSTGHLNTENTSVILTTVTSCGTNPALSGNDISGTITTGSGSPTSCTLTFANRYTNTPVCVCSPNAGVSCGVSSSSASSVTFALSVTETKINYICIGSD
jgi:hypothetical protein